MYVPEDRSPARAYEHLLTYAIRLPLCMLQDGGGDAPTPTAGAASPRSPMAPRRRIGVQIMP